jgi:hypothetical protein
MYIIRRMRVRLGSAACAVLALLLTAACGIPLGRQYEYEEQLYLSVDGSATIILDASLPALAALRGLVLDAGARMDRTTIRRAFEAGGCEVVSVAQPWRRKGRRFIQVRLRTADIRTLNSCQWLSWSSYRLEPEGETLRYQQIVGAPAGGDAGSPGWDGSEIVGFKLHLPSRVIHHNVKLFDGTNGTVERGNILTWEQRLADRLAGKPIDMVVTLSAQSILYQTLGLFAGAFLAAVLLLGGIVWWVMKRKIKRFVI